MSTEEPTRPVDFIRAIINEDNASGKHGGRVHTRFPPEPNGYLHIGHAKSICLNFGIERATTAASATYGSTTRTRPKKSREYVDSIMEDVRWLGFQWDELALRLRLLPAALRLGRATHQEGKAYVCDLTGDQVRETRGTLSEPGKNSPFRDRTPKENLELFEQMKAGKFADGARTLRAKIDMASPNFNLRDPVMYRILHAEHHRTGDKWCIYPMYDWTHGESDSLERITHSICTLEFENHRPLYDWYVEALASSIRDRSSLPAKPHLHGDEQTQAA